MSIRTQKVAKLIKEELSQIFLLKVEDNQTGLITISNVKLTPDLKIARIYYSAYEKQKRKALAEKLESKKIEIRKDLASKIKNMRFIPELEFYLDDTLDYVEEIEILLSKVRENDNKE